MPPSFAPALPPSMPTAAAATAAAATTTTTTTATMQRSPRPPLRAAPGSLPTEPRCEGHLRRQRSMPALRPLRASTGRTPQAGAPADATACDADGLQRRRQSPAGTPPLFADAMPAASPQQPLPPPPVAPERELLVLVHGLQGAVEDFTYLLDTLRATPAARAGQLFVHATRVNTERTHDGVHTGGERVAADVRAVVARHALGGDALTHISFMGFSLGGLYTRYALARLFDDSAVADADHRDKKAAATGATATIAGLQPRSLALVASPLLGVRRFGFYRFMRALHRTPGLGVTVRQLVLADDEQLLERMTLDDGGDGQRYISAMSAFPHRVLYANLRNDFMVNYGTAALDVRVSGVGGPEVDRVLQEAERVACIDRQYDLQGCRICFRVRVDGDAVGGGGDGGDGEAGGLLRRRATIGGVFGGRRDGRDGGRSTDGGLQWARSARTRSAKAGEMGASEDAEEVMAQRLRAIGWWVVGVDFPLALPIAHNRIVAMSRNAIHTWMNAPGRRVVHHLVDAIVLRMGGAPHKRLFRRVDDDGEVEEPEPEPEPVVVAESMGMGVSMGEDVGLDLAMDGGHGNMRVAR